MDLLLPIRPNTASGTPLYAQLVDQVRRSLTIGTLRPGDPLPDAPRLAQALVIPPSAVARAYRELEGIGLVTRSQGGYRASAPGHGGLPDSVSGASTWFASEDHRLAAQLAADAAERAARARELRSARAVQERMLPQVLPAIERLDYAGLSRAAHGVGGDYYDFVLLPDGRLAIALADVCGKGVPAALLMAALRAYLHGAGAARQGTPGALAEALNHLVHESVTADRFVTMFYGVFNPATRELDYVNAGHLPPILQGRARRTERLEGDAPALGLMPGVRFESRRIVLEPGDVLLAFTDGITDALDPEGDEWGEAGLIAALQVSKGQAARAVADAVLAAADRFAAGVPQFDDMSLVVARVS